MRGSLTIDGSSKVVAKTLVLKHRGQNDTGFVKSATDTQNKTPMDRIIAVTIFPRYLLPPDFPSAARADPIFYVYMTAWSTSSFVPGAGSNKKRETRV
jgi:hypothetical protein